MPSKVTNEVPARSGDKLGKGESFVTFPHDQRRDPLHGITLEQILIELVDHLGWEKMGQRVRIQCFRSDPSISSSLKFLRRTPWARKKVEEMYLAMKGNPTLRQ